jgi:lipopolysaccharide cholinephosphotransferase
MSKISRKTLKKTQSIILDMLDEVDRVCKKHKLTYWIDGGALLGAIKYGGFVRWDDDLDIAMPIEDYEKFCLVAKHELPNGMFFQHRQTDKHFPYDCVKIRDDRGIMVEKHQVGKDINYNQGIFLDIYPVLTIKRFFLYRIIHIILFLAIKVFSYKYLNIKSIRDILVSWSEKFHRGWGRDSKVVRSGNHPTIRFYVDERSIFPLSTALFENRVVPVPNNVDHYLRSLFPKGYKNPLPKEAKRAPHAFDIKLKD